MTTAKRYSSYNSTIGFTPTVYSAVKSATTTVTGQSLELADSTTVLRVSNLDGTNYVLIAFGTSASNAETNAANGVPLVAGSTDYLRKPDAATHVAWLGDTAAVETVITEGI